MGYGSISRLSSQVLWGMCLLPMKATIAFKNSIIVEIFLRNGGKKGMPLDNWNLPGVWAVMHLEISMSWIVPTSVCKNLMKQGTRAAIADGWGGSMLATDLQDIIFGTPSPNISEANLGVMKEDMVNIVIHGHEPVLSEMIVTVSQTKEMMVFRLIFTDFVSLKLLCLINPLVFVMNWDRVLWCYTDTT